MQLSLNIRTIDYSKTVMYWDVENDIREDFNKFLYMPQISESIEGAWIDLLKEPIFAFGFMDTKTQRGMVDKRLYYRIKAIYINNGSESYSNLVCLEDGTDNYISNYIARQERLMLRRFNGRESLLYPRRKFGPRCKHCYSEIDRKIIKSKCEYCFGTTYEGGYFAPTKIHVAFEPNNKSNDKNDFEVSEGVQLSGWTSSECIIEPDDIIITLKNPDSRFKVMSIIESALQDSITKQMLGLVQIKPDRVEQLLPIDVAAYFIDEFNIFRRDRDK